MPQSNRQPFPESRQPGRRIQSQSNTDTLDSESPLGRPKIRHQTGSTALYIRGVPFLPLRDVKCLLVQRPVCVQIRHIGNISWIDQTILELLVDSNHVHQMKNRISKNPNFHIRTSFDPLSATSYNWETAVTPETQEKILQEDFVNRIASSIASSRVDSTRRYLMEWGRNLWSWQPAANKTHKPIQNTANAKSFSS
jgi:hypothetical protein